MARKKKEEISEEVLETMDAAMENLKEGVTSDPINVDDLKNVELVEETASEENNQSSATTIFGTDLVLYGRSSCHVCNMAKALLERAEIPFTYVSSSKEIISIQKAQKIQSLPFMLNSKGNVFTAYTIKAVIDKMEQEK